MAKITREVAQRIFAKELNATTDILEREEGKYAAQYVLTPTGAKVNRVLVVGTITEIEDVGSDAPYWRVRIADPTGAFTGYAGEYQPEAAHLLSSVQVPDFRAIVGKVHIFVPDDGGTIVSIRPEMVAPADLLSINRWTLQTAQQTLARIKHLETISEEAINDMKPYREMVRDALAGIVLE